MPIEWDSPLHYRRGSQRRLAGLDVYYDFDWRTVFGHTRSVFPKGQSLAELVTRECPGGKEPTLLLTIREDASAGIRETDDRYIAIIPIEQYLAQAGADAASTFYARLSSAPLTQLATLSDAVFTEGELGRFLEAHLNRERLEEWADTAEAHRETLWEVAELHVPDSFDVLGTLQGLEEIDLAQLDALMRRIQEIGGVEATVKAVEALTSSREGREATAAAIAGRLEQRIQDARAKLADYTALISKANVREVDVQEFLERNPWIVGLAYVRARPRVDIPRGEVDFVLDRYDGFFDILELKGPDDEIIGESSTRSNRPPSPSGYVLGSNLAKALAQAHLYRSILERTQDLADQFGLADTRQPRIMILVGRSSDLSETGRDILRQLNLSLHRVEIVPYDVVGKRSEGWLNNIEELLQTSAADTENG